MGEANTAVNQWLSDNKRFADLFNGTLFEGGGSDPAGGIGRAGQRDGRIAWYNRKKRASHPEVPGYCKTLEERRNFGCAGL